MFGLNNSLLALKLAHFWNQSKVSKFLTPDPAKFPKLQLHHSGSPTLHTPTPTQPHTHASIYVQPVSFYNCLATVFPGLGGSAATHRDLSLS